MEKLVEKIPFNGSKAYVAGFFLILLGIGSFLGYVDCGDPFALVAQGLSVLGLRHAMSKASLDKIVALIPQVVAIIQEIRRRQVNPDTPIEIPDIPVNPNNPPNPPLG